MNDWRRVILRTLASISDLNVTLSCLNNVNSSLTRTLSSLCCVIIFIMALNRVASEGGGADDEEEDEGGVSVFTSESEEDLNSESEEDIARKGKEEKRGKER